MTTPEEAPDLTEWITCTQAADILGITRQSVNRMVNAGEFKTLHRLGERPIFVLKKGEVDKMSTTRTFRKAPKP